MKCCFEVSCIWSFSRYKKPLHTHGRVHMHWENAQFCRLWWQCLDRRHIWEHQKKIHTLDPATKHSDRISLGWLEASITCIGPRKNHPLGKGCTKVILEGATSYLKLWPIMIYGSHAFFGIMGSHNDINMLQFSQMFAILVAAMLWGVGCMPMRQ